MVLQTFKDVIYPCDGRMRIRLDVTGQLDAVAKGLADLLRVRDGHGRRELNLYGHVLTCRFAYVVVCNAVVRASVLFLDRVDLEYVTPEKQHNYMVHSENQVYFCIRLNVYLIFDTRTGTGCRQWAELRCSPSSS
jgi:hypothetical protein